MAFIIIPFLNTFTAVLSVFLNTFPKFFLFLIFVTRSYSDFTNVLVSLEFKNILIIKFTSDQQGGF